MNLIFHLLGGQLKSMPLAVSSYENLSVIADQEEILNLRWTLDERDYLLLDLGAIIVAELAAEEKDRLPFVNTYFVQDPYSEKLLKPSVTKLFSRMDKNAGISCGAGVNSLLFA